MRTIHKTLSYIKDGPPPGQFDWAMFVVFISPISGFITIIYATLFNLVFDAPAYISDLGAMVIIAHATMFSFCLQKYRQHRHGRR